MSYVNENIRVLRNRMGLTQEKFAALMGINRKVVGSYEENRATPPLDKLNRMASLFGVSLDQLTQHRFSAESPLFEEEEVHPALPASALPTPSVPVATVPAALPERKRPFSRTGGHAIPYIAHKYFDKYLLDVNFSARLSEMPAFSVPYAEADKVYRAFDVPADARLQEGVVICEEVREDTAVQPNLLYFLVTKDKGMLLASLESTALGSWKVKSEEEGYFVSSEVREIWKPIGYFSRTLPQPSIDMKGIAAKVNALKNQIDGLL
jgi:transcriptional regulator with XRE-family HTH domain